MKNLKMNTDLLWAYACSSTSSTYSSTTSQQITLTSKHYRNSSMINTSTTSSNIKNMSASTSTTHKSTHHSTNNSQRKIAHSKSTKRSGGFRTAHNKSSTSAPLSIISWPSTIKNKLPWACLGSGEFTYRSTKERTGRHN